MRSLQEIVKRFNTTPFIFAGSGLSRRYYDLPDWKGLLSYFAGKVKKDAYAFQYYDNMARQETVGSDVMPIVATLIEKDFNELWFNDVPGIRTNTPEVDKFVLSGGSPFKAELAEYISSVSKTNSTFSGEIHKLKEISIQNISGIITTNYDTFFEELFDGYKVFVGQDELIFSQLQGIAEIYKIHGSVSNPESIVINSNDYKKYKEKSKYLSAKLMTIFMEYPIIFMGYSISDSDIQMLLSDIVECLPHNKIDILKDRFVFVTYDAQMDGIDISSLSMTFGTDIIEMTKITTSDFSDIYSALKEKKAAFPVKLLRRFKDDLYEFALTSQTRSTIQVAPLTDQRINEETLALTIGLAKTGVYGLARAITSEDWYRNIVFEDLQYSADELLEYSYVDLAKQNSWKLPVWYYISRASKVPDIAFQKAMHKYTDIVSDDAVAKYQNMINGRSIEELWEKEKHEKAVLLIANLPEKSVEVQQIEKVIKKLFEEEPNVLHTWKTPYLSSVKRIIRMYDYLKYKAKTP